MENITNITHVSIYDYNYSKLQELWEETTIYNLLDLSYTCVHSCMCMDIRGDTRESFLGCLRSSRNEGKSQTTCSHNINHK